MHESHFHAQSCFITLTYREEDLPPGRSLVREDFVLFMKRFREAIGMRIRNVYCGEYGAQKMRPHFHAIIFGYDFFERDKDITLWKVNKNGDCVWQSPMLEEFWKKGMCTSGAVTWQSSAYVARYIMKKVSGELAEDHYWNRDPVTGKKLNPIVPEFFQPSNRYGIGKEFFWNYWKEIYPNDYVVVDGRKYKPPRYYDKLLKEQDADMYEFVKQKREERAKENAFDSTWARLEAREKVKMAAFDKLVRDLE